MNKWFEKLEWSEVSISRREGTQASRQVTLFELVVDSELSTGIICKRDIGEQEPIGEITPSCLDRA